MASVLTTTTRVLATGRNANQFICLKNVRVLSSFCYVNEKLQRIQTSSHYCNVPISASKRYSVAQHSVSCVRFFSKDVGQSPKDKNEETSGEKKLTLFQKFKDMYKNYWYVLVPVHLVTSAAWFGGFYYLAKSGVDIVSLLESMSVSEALIKPFRSSSMGYVAVAYALYKIATPARYTVTLGGTTISINYLKKWGYIKPVPSKAEFKEMYIERKEHLIETMREKKEEMKDRADKLRDKKDDIMEGLEKKLSFTTENKNIAEKLETGAKKDKEKSKTSETIDNEERELKGIKDSKKQT